MINMKKELIIIVIIVLTLCFGIYVFPDLPSRVPSHWNASGEIDNWSSKEFSVYFFPALTLLMYLLLTFLPYIDPFYDNYKKFNKQYFLFKLGFVVFISLLYIFTLLFGLGFDLNINYFIIPLFSAGMILMGLFLPKVKRNFFIGIRTPWTIYSDLAWDKTHKLAGKTFIVVGILMLLVMGFLSPENFFWFFIIAISVASLIPVVYSFFIFRKHD